MSEEIRRMYEELGIPGSYRPSDGQPLPSIAGAVDPGVKDRWGYTTDDGSPTPDGVPLTTAERLNYTPEELGAIGTLLDRFREAEAADPDCRRASWPVVVSDTGRADNRTIETPGLTRNALSGVEQLLKQRGLDVTDSYSQRDSSRILFVKKSSAELQT